MPDLQHLVVAHWWGAVKLSVEDLEALQKLRGPTGGYEAARPQQPQWPRQTPSGPEPLMQREPGWQRHRREKQVFLSSARFAGARGHCHHPKSGRQLQSPSLHVELGSLQSVSNTQAKAGVEVRQRIVITTRLAHAGAPHLEQPFQNHITECPKSGQAKARGGVEFTELGENGSVYPRPKGKPRMAGCGISGLVIAPSSQWVALASAEAGTMTSRPRCVAGDLLRQGSKPSVNVASHLVFGNAVAFLDFAF